MIQSVDLISFFKAVSFHILEYHLGQPYVLSKVQFSVYGI